MSFYTLKKQVYVFGGCRWFNNEFFSDFHMFDLETRSWTELSQNDEKLKERTGQSTNVVFSSEWAFEYRVYVIGGRSDKATLHNDIVKFSFEDWNLRALWVLHFLKVTGFYGIISINMHEDLVKMYQGR